MTDPLPLARIEELERKAEQYAERNRELVREPIGVLMRAGWKVQIEMGFAADSYVDLFPPTAMAQHHTFGPRPH